MAVSLVGLPLVWGSPYTYPKPTLFRVCGMCVYLAKTLSLFRVLKLPDNLLFKCESKRTGNLDISQHFRAWCCVFNLRFYQGFIVGCVALVPRCSVA